MDKRRYMLDEWIKILKGKWKGDYTHLAIYDYGKAANWRYDECPCLPEQCFSNGEFEARLAETEKDNDMNESTLVPREEISDLDWLARNVHKWPKDTPVVIRPGDAIFKFGAVFYGDCVAFSGEVETEYRRVNKDQWLARRAELQNKPSWTDAPEWADFISQSISGVWHYHEFKPDNGTHGYFSVKGKYTHQCSGEVLGDWHDTLEKRPEVEPEISYNLNCEGFVPFFSVEDAQQELGNLDWLAASITEWPQIKDWNVKMDRGVSFFDDGVHIYNSDGSDYETISKRDWEIKVMELNKKPSIQTAKALAEAKLIEGKEPAGVYGVDHFYKPVCTGVAEDAATAKQPAPKGSGNPILGMVLADLTNRALEGKEKYGEPLLAHNGRNPLWDAYQEALDLAMYLRQAIEDQK